MPEPAFEMQHFIACSGASPSEPTGPNVAYHLANVSYTYRMPQTVTAAALIKSFALYARFIRTDDCDGIVPFRFQMYCLDAPNGSALVAKGSLDSVDFPSGCPVVNVVWRLSNLAIPGRGLYEFRLSGGTDFRDMASEYIRIE